MSANDTSYSTATYCIRLLHQCFVAIKLTSNSTKERVTKLTEVKEIMKILKLIRQIDEHIYESYWNLNLGG